MKNCPMCGAQAVDDDTLCAKCNYQFDNLEPGVGDANNAAGVAGSDFPPDWGKPKRPDGTTPMSIGWISLAIAALLLLFSFVVGPDRLDVSLASSPYASARRVQSVADAAERQFLMQLVAGAFFSLFLAFWSVGYIVRAISFLPGKDEGLPDGD